MDVLPVLDLLNGIVVRGIAGRRSEYQPLRTCLTSSIQPLDVARALRTSFGFGRLYIADLDAILHHRPNWDVYRRLIDDGFQLQIDAGIQNVEQSQSVRQIGAEPIIGLESCPNPTVLIDVVGATQGELTFSLDLMNGHPLLSNDATGWSNVPGEIVRQAVSSGIQRMIVLDLADVGTSRGTKTVDLCRSILAEFPDLKLTCGGGVRGPDDLRNLTRIGVVSVLVASALHDGRLSSVDLRQIGEP